MPDPDPLLSDPAAAHWAALVARAAARLRGERARAGAFLGALAAVPLFALSAATSALAHPDLARALLATALALPALGALVGRFRPLDPARLHTRIDRQFGLADEALAARELAGLASPAWRAAILRQAVAHTSSADWKTAWPVRWPRRSGLAASAALLAALLALLQLPSPGSAAPDPAAARRAEQKTALSELAKDWEKTAEEMKGEEWDAFRASVAELQKKLDAPELSERELLVALARVESRLAEASRTLAEAALASSSEELAEALAGLENLDAATDALRKKDFAAAAKALDQASAKLSAADAKLALRDASGAETARRLDKLAEKAAQKREGSKLAKTAKQMREAVERRDAKSLGECSASLADDAREAAACEASSSSLAALSRSLAGARLALAEGKKPGENDAAFSLAGQGRSPGSAQPGAGVGASAGDHSPGAEHDLAAASRQENLSGQANADGESTRRTVRATEAAPTLASAAGEADLAEFTRLSREAVEDESLPLEHRRAIHRYFQLIRPGSDTASAVSTSP
jgi:hypothetical protein